MARGNLVKRLIMKIKNKVLMTLLAMVAVKEPAASKSHFGFDLNGWVPSLSGVIVEGFEDITDDE